jgi:apolipoprotein N-acyltransferase
VLRLPFGTVGVLISYEVFFEDRARAAVAAGAEILVVPTNASSYRQAQVPAQEVAAARLRAIEAGRWLVQAAPTGYSAVIDPEGRVRQQSSLGPSAVITAWVESRRGRTLASFLGGPPVVFLAALGLLAANLSGIRSGLMRFR